jgi:hypothetical protein
MLILRRLRKKNNSFKPVIFIYFKKKKLQKYNYVFKNSNSFFFCTKNINMFHFTDNIFALLFTKKTLCFQVIIYHTSILIVTN